MPDIQWVEITDKPWGTRVLDLRPVTLSMTATSGDPQCAANALSFRNEDGTAFIGQEPAVARIIEAHLQFQKEKFLADGVLFNPSQMEHKWAIFYHQHQMMFVQSWRREVRVIAYVEEHETHIVLTSVQGTFCEEDEDPSLTLRVLDFLIKSHARGIDFPAPLSPGMERDSSKAAMWCFSMFGNMAQFATPHPILSFDLNTPLRTDSLLHIAVARGDIHGIRAQLELGAPLDLLSRDGLALLHWALATQDPGVMALLLEEGSPVAVRSSEGATPLMNAVQNQKPEHITYLLSQGARVNARDRRGFTALHRAAEMGYMEGVQLLLGHGASPQVEAQGHTPGSLAGGREESAISALLGGCHKPLN